MFEDPLFWILVLPGLLLGIYAQSRIKINIAKYSQVRTKDGITGGQVARLLLDSQGLRNVAIVSSHIAAKSGDILCTKHIGCWNRSP